MKKIISYLDKNLEIAFISIITALISILMFMQVILRYCFSTSIAWVEEVVVYMNIWIAFIGVGYSMKHGTDMKMDFSSVLPAKLNKVTQYISEIIFLLFYVMIARAGFIVIASMVARGQRSPAARIPLYVVYSALLVGALIAIARYIQKVYIRVAERKEKQKALEAENS